MHTNRINIRHFKFLKLVSLALFAFSTVNCSHSSSDEHWLTKLELAVTPGANGAVTLGWRVNEGYSYSIYRSENEDSGYAFVASTSSKTYTDAVPSSNQTYYYKVLQTTSSSQLSNVDDSTIPNVAGFSSLCFDKAYLRGLKTSPDLPTLQSNLAALYGQCADIVAQRISRPLTAPEKKAIFSTFLSHNMAPYGGSVAADVFDLLHEDVLDCDNYALLAAYFYELLAGSSYTEDLYLAGFDHGAVGNHAQLIFTSSNGSLLLDPTIGIAAVTTYSDLMDSTALGALEIDSFYSYWDDGDQPDSLQTYFWRVQTALSLGLYKQQDYLYIMYPTKNLGVSPIP